jgi:DNA-binding response OmpR family regulator
VTIGLEDDLSTAPPTAGGALARRPDVHDALILDLRLPRIGGPGACRRLREKGFKTPILVLTACGGADASPDSIAAPTTT